MNTVAGLMNTPKYAKNVIRTGDIGANAPRTVLTTDTGGFTIVLPLPVNITSQMGADWQQEGVGILKSYGMHNKAEIRELIDSTQSYTDVMRALDQKGAEIIRNTNKDVKAIMARSRDTNSLLGGLRLKANPRNEMLFQGMPFKSYSFQFNLVPMREQDSQAIHRAIHTIQYASSPDMKFEKMFMEYPNTWFIKFLSNDGDGNRYLVKINECACTGINVNYTAQGDSSNMHKENAPIAVELGLEFSEVFIPSRGTIQEGFYG